MGAMPSHQSRLEVRAVDVATCGGNLIRPLGVAEIPAGPVSLRSAAGEWLIVGAEHDPHLKAGRLVMPDAVVAHLEAIARSKIKFDRLFVAHELPSGALKEGDHAKFGPAELDRVIPAPAPDPRTLATLASCLRIAQMAASLCAVPVTAAAGLADRLDPALMGVVTAMGRADAGDLAVWFLLAAWT